VKKLASFLSVFLLIVALLLTGCSADKKGTTGLNNNSVNKVSSNIGETESKDTPFSLENESKLSDNSKSEVGPINTDMPQTISVPTTNTNNQANPSSQTPVNQAPNPIPIKPENTDKKAVTIAINCQTAVAKGLDKQEKFKDVVPANGIILPPTKVEFNDGDTVFDVLKLVVRENKIQMQYEGSKGNPYIKGINNLYEFDSGPLSGWMYCVNKLYVNYGCNETKLKNGDAIEWNYTCDMGKDLGK